MLDFPEIFFEGEKRKKMQGKQNQKKQKNKKLPKRKNTVRFSDSLWGGNEVGEKGRFCPLFFLSYSPHC